NGQGRRARPSRRRCHADRSGGAPVGAAHRRAEAPPGRDRRQDAGHKAAAQGQRHRHHVRLVSLKNAAVLALLLPISTATCAHAPSPPPGMARLRLRCCYQGEAWDAKTSEWQMACRGTAPLATVLIDGVDRGACADWQQGKYLAAGTYHV